MEMFRAPPFVNQVRLVAHKDDYDIAAALCPHLLNPPRSVQEGLPVCNIMSNLHFACMLISSGRAATLHACSWQRPMLQAALT